MHHNPPSHSKASNAYGSTAASTDQRALEAKALMKSAQMLEDLARRVEKGEKPGLEEIGATLTHNRKLWQLFLDEMMNKESQMPLEIRNNVASLAVFVFKRTQEVLADAQPEKFKVLVNINRNIAAGLMKRPAQPATAPGSTAKSPAEATNSLV